MTSSRSAAEGIAQSRTECRTDRERTPGTIAGSGDVDLEAEVARNRLAWEAELLADPAGPAHSPVPKAEAETQEVRSAASAGEPCAAWGRS